MFNMFQLLCGRSSVLKMAVLLYFMFCAAVMFQSFSEAETDSESYKKGVELALQQVNSHTGIKQHFLFFKTIEQSSIETGFGVKYFYYHFYLKATTCNRGTENEDLKKCTFRNDRPLIDCVICYKTHAGEIEKDPKPFIHCVHKPALNEEMKKIRLDHCNKVAYGSGSSTLLASTGTQ